MTVTSQWRICRACWTLRSPTHAGNQARQNLARGLTDAVDAAGGQFPFEKQRTLPNPGTGAAPSRRRPSQCLLSTWPVCTLQTTCTKWINRFHDGAHACSCTSAAAHVRSKHENTAKTLGEQPSTQTHVGIIELELHTSALYCIMIDSSIEQTRSARRLGIGAPSTNDLSHGQPIP